MTNVKLINNEWKKIVNSIEFSSEEKEKLKNIKDLPPEERKSLLDSINERKLQKLSAEEEEKVQKIYDDNKIDGSVLIDVDIFLPEGNGIINCRVEGEHKQIRF